MVWTLFNFLFRDPAYFLYLFVDTWFVCFVEVILWKFHFIAIYGWYIEIELILYIEFSASYLDKLSY